MGEGPNVFVVVNGVALAVRRYYRTRDDVDFEIMSTSFIHKHYHITQRNKSKQNECSMFPDELILCHCTNRYVDK